LLIFDLTSSGSLITSLQEPVPKVDLLFDILSTATMTSNVPTINGTTVPQTNQVNSTPSMSEIPSIVAYSKNGIEVTFHFVKSNQAGLTQVNAVFRNSNAYTINDFSFMVAVPKYMNLEVQPSSGKQLLGLVQNQQTQKFRLINHFHGQKPLVIKIQLSYTDESGNKAVDTAQVSHFPPNC